MHSASDLDIDFVGGRAALLADTALQGRHFSDAYRTLTDAWLAQLFERAAGDQQGVALLAVGGYGRGELCPGSDLDVLLLHAPKTDVAKLAERIWYPIWDAKVHLGHAVRTVKEALSLAADDLDTATALLDARLIAGDAQLADALYAGARASWTKRSRKWFGALKASVDERSARAGEVAFLLEPDLKLGAAGCATCTRCAGPRPPGRCCSTATPTRSTRPTTSCWPCASSCSAPRASAAATCCCCRTRTRWPRPSATPMPTSSCRGWRRPRRRSPGRSTTCGGGPRARPPRSGVPMVGRCRPASC